MTPDFADDPESIARRAVRKWHAESERTGRVEARYADPKAARRILAHERLRAAIEDAAIKILELPGGTIEVDGVTYRAERSAERGGDGVCRATFGGGDGMIDPKLWRNRAGSRSTSRSIERSTPASFSMRSSSTCAGSRRRSSTTRRARGRARPASIFARSTERSAAAAGAIRDARSRPIRYDLRNAAGVVSATTNGVYSNGGGSMVTAMKKSTKKPTSANRTTRRTVSMHRVVMNNKELEVAGITSPAKLAAYLTKWFESYSHVGGGEFSLTIAGSIGSVAKTPSGR